MADALELMFYFPRDVTRAQALRVAQDMREALLALPPPPFDPPAKSIDFNWHFWNRDHPNDLISP